MSRQVRRASSDPWRPGDMGPSRLAVSPRAVGTAECFEPVCAPACRRGGREETRAATVLSARRAEAHHHFCAPATGRNSVMWGVTESQEACSLQLTSVSVTAEGGPRAVPTGAFFELSAHSNLTPPKLFSLRPLLIILSVTPCRPPSPQNTLPNNALSPPLPLLPLQSIPCRCLVPSSHQDR